MKTLEKTAKRLVLDALLENLRQLSPEVDWIPSHPYIIDYIRAMGESHRSHHSWTRVSHMLQEMDILPYEIVQNPLHLQAAIFFSNIVCVPCAQHNKAKSTLFCSKFYTGQTKERITQLILATEHEFPFSSFDDDRDVVCDLDLIPLGFGREQFDLFQLEIRDEHGGYCTIEEFDDRTRVFFERLWKQMESGTHIYRTQFFREKYESRAFENIQRTLASYA